MSHHLGVEEYFSHIFERLRLDVETRRRQDRAFNRFNGIYTSDQFSVVKYLITKSNVLIRITFSIGLDKQLRQLLNRISPSWS